jgi:hypothetical protein
VPIRRVRCGKRTRIWCVCGALHLLAKRKAPQNKQDEKETAPRRGVVGRIFEVFVSRYECFEDYRFHDVGIFTPFAVFRNTQNCVRILLSAALSSAVFWETHGVRRFAEASTCFVIPHLLQQNDVRINRPENVCRCRDPLCLYFRRRIMRRAVWEPFQVPGCDANPGWFRRITER